MKEDEWIDKVALFTDYKTTVSTFYNIRYSYIVILQRKILQAEILLQTNR